MPFVRSIQQLEPVFANGKTILYMLGYGGRSWQARRHLRMLQNRGFRLLVLDFRDVLQHRDPQDLVSLMDEVAAIVDKEGLAAKDTIVVGVSLGGLIGYNLIRRYSSLDKLLVITGGDMTHIPSKKALQRQWRLSRAELAQRWDQVNIYTPVGALRDKHVVMLLPSRDKVIDPGEVANEIARHAPHNDFQIITTPGGHFRTIIHQTILAPRQSWPFIEYLARL